MARIKRILVPIDFSSCAEQALEEAVRIAQQLGAQIDLLHVIQWPVHYEYPAASEDYRRLLEEMRDRSTEKLGAIGERVTGQQIEATTRTVEGLAPDEIVESAEELGSDLIVMGTRGRTGLDHLLLGSVAERTIRDAPCPVLAVPGPTQA